MRRGYDVIGTLLSSVGQARPMHPADPLDSVTGADFPFDLTIDRRDAMSRNRSFHPVPRGGIDPIRSAADALAVLALAAPYGHDTIAILLDGQRRGSSILIVDDTVDDDAIFTVIDTCVAVSRRTREHGAPVFDGLILASSRPDGDATADDVPRWLEASDQCRAGGLELVEWFVLGRSGVGVPRAMFGEPERWAA
jgi:hypothetical protein